MLAVGINEARREKINKYLMNPLYFTRIIAIDAAHTFALEKTYTWILWNVSGEEALIGVLWLIKLNYAAKNIIYV